MKKLFLLLAISVIMPAFAQNKSVGNTRTIPVKSISDNTYLLTVPATDPSYGFSKENPIKVGSEGSGPKNERRFLNALLGPGGAPVEYWRRGSCCHFETPNGLIQNMGMLDAYGITVVNSKDTFILYLNMYDDGNLEIPVGFTAKE